MSSVPSTASTGKESGLRVPSNGKTIYHRPINRTKTSELSQASFAFLFSEMVAYAQKRVKGIQELEHKFVFPPADSRPSFRPELHNLWLCASTLTYDAIL